MVFQILNSMKPIYFLKEMWKSLHQDEHLRTSWQHFVQFSVFPFSSVAKIMGQLITLPHLLVQPISSSIHYSWHEDKLNYFLNFQLPRNFAKFCRAKFTKFWEFFLRNKFYDEISLCQYLKKFSKISFSILSIWRNFAKFHSQN